MLESLIAHPPPAELEILLTENLPVGRTEIPTLPGWDLVRVENAKPQGYARNHNQAFRRARGEYFCVLNPDIEFVSDVFPVLLETLEANLGQIVAPLVVDRRGVIQDSFRSLPTPSELLARKFFRRRSTPSDPTGIVIHPDWIAGMFLLTRSEVFRRVGGFDEKYTLYFEDVDFGCRARLAGFRLAVDTRGRVVHHARRSSRKNLRHLLWHIQSAARFFQSDTYRWSRQSRTGGQREGRST